MLELWISIPVGFALNMHPLLIAGITCFGSIWSVLVVIVIGERAVAFILKIRGKRFSEKTGKTYLFWEKYGIPGLGLISPVLLGAPIGAAIGISLGVKINKIILWMSIGIIFWTAVITTVLHFGLFSIHSIL